MMNKKGQVLVVFVLLLPLIVIFLGLVIDIGNSLVLKKKYENIIKDIIVYNYKEDTKTDEELINNNETEELIDEEIVDATTEVTEEVKTEVQEKEVDLLLIERNIKDSIADYDEVNISVDENILKVNVKTQYKSIFSKIFNIGLNVINIEVKYDIQSKKLVRE